MTKDDVIRINGPSSRCPIIIDIPHAGRQYPKDFTPHCPLIYLRRVEDAYLDHLIAGIDLPVLSTPIARCVIDCNRAVADIDDSMIAGGWDGPVFHEYTSNGIGLIMRFVGHNLPIYHRKLTADQIKSRIDNIYHPYHRALEGLIARHHRPGHDLLHINLHSMPSDTAPADIVIGNRHGQTADHHHMKLLASLFEERGLSVAMNDQYAGVEIIKRHSNPTIGIHSIQVEINRKLYLEEVSVKKSKQFDQMGERLKNVLHALRAEMIEFNQIPMAVAAQ